jgi:hypothetical protein
MDPTTVFCPNLACPARGRAGQRNIRIHARQDRRFLCTECHKTFTATKGTAFYRLRTSAETVTLVVTRSHHGVDRTARAQPGQDERHHVCSRPQPIEGHALGGHEGLATTGPAIALRCVAMPPHVPLAPLPSGRARWVVAALGVRVHRRPPVDAILPSRAHHVRQEARRTRFFANHQPPHHG